MAIDKKSRLLKIGGSEIDRLFKKESKELNIGCDCASENCDHMRYFNIENSYTLYLEKIGKRKRPDITNTCYIDFGNLHENTILEMVNSEYKTKYKEKNNIISAEFGKYSVINVDGYDKKADIKLLEIKTTTKKPKLDWLKYYNQVQYYMHVMGLDKVMIAIAERPEIYHWNKKEIANIKIDTVHCAEFDFDKKYFESEILPKVNNFVQMLKMSERYDIVMSEETYNDMMFPKKKGTLKFRRSFVPKNYKKITKK
jgi:hypothetical protein